MRVARRCSGPSVAPFRLTVQRHIADWHGDCSDCWVGEDRASKGVKKGWVGMHVLVMYSSGQADSPEVVGVKAALSELGYEPVELDMSGFDDARLDRIAAHAQACRAMVAVGVPLDPRRVPGDRKPISHWLAYWIGAASGRLPGRLPTVLVHHPDVDVSAGPYKNAIRASIPFRAEDDLGWLRQQLETELRKLTVTPSPPFPTQQVSVVGVDLKGFGRAPTTDQQAALAHELGKCAQEAIVANGEFAAFDLISTGDGFLLIRKIERGDNHWQRTIGLLRRIFEAASRTECDRAELQIRASLTTGQVSVVPQPLGRSTYIGVPVTSAARLLNRKLDPELREVSESEGTGMVFALDSGGFSPRDLDVLATAGVTLKHSASSVQKEGDGAKMSVQIGWFGAETPTVEFVTTANVTPRGGPSALGSNLESQEKQKL